MRLVRSDCESNDILKGLAHGRTMKALCQGKQSVCHVLFVAMQVYTSRANRKYPQRSRFYGKVSCTLL